MAKRQKLIHLHSGELKANKVLTPSLLEKGEIAVRHASNEPELYIRKEDDTLATFIDEIAIDKKIQNSFNSGLTNTIEEIGILEGKLDGHIESANTKFGEIDNSLEALGTWSAATETAVKTTLPKNITDAKAEAIGAASAYTDSEVKKVSDTLDALNNELYANASGNAKSIWSISYQVLAQELLGETKADDNFKTLQELATWLEDHPEDAAAMNSSISALQTWSGLVETAIKTTLPNSVKEVSDALDAHVQSANTKFGAIDNSLEALGTWSAATETAVKTTLPKNITDAKAEAIGAASAYTDSEVKKVSDTLDGHVGAANTKFSAIDNSLEALGTWSAATNTAVNTTLPKNITDAKAEAIGAASAYTDSEVKKVSDTLDGHVGAANTKFGEIDNSLEALGTWSAATETAVKTTLPKNITDAKAEAIGAASAYTDSEVKKVSDALDALDSEVVKNVVVNNLSGVTATATIENTVTINFESMIIDCGEF